MQLRPAHRGDADTIVEFNMRMAQETEGLQLDPALIAPGVRAMIEDRAKGRYFVAEREGRVVGQIGVTTEWSDWRNGHFWWIQSVYVAPEARRTGVFRALYEHVRAEAKRQPGVIGLRLYVEEHNAAAQTTYDRLGMKMSAYRVMEEYPLR
jgi:GNAT superfamily N-acetyltransferase